MSLLNLLNHWIVNNEKKSVYEQQLLVAKGYIVITLHSKDSSSHIGISTSSYTALTFKYQMNDSAGCVHSLQLSTPPDTSAFSPESDAPAVQHNFLAVSSLKSRAILIS